MMKPDQKNRFKALVKFCFDMYYPQEKFMYTEDYVNWAGNCAEEWINKSKKTIEFETFREYIKSQFTDYMDCYDERVNKYAMLSADIFEKWIEVYNVKTERI